MQNFLKYGFGQIRAVVFQPYHKLINYSLMEIPCLGLCYEKPLYFI